MRFEVRNLVLISAVARKYDVSRQAVYHRTRKKGVDNRGLCRAEGVPQAAVLALNLDRAWLMAYRQKNIKNGAPNTQVSSLGN